MKAFVSAQMTQEGLQKLAEYAEIKLGGWGHTGKKLTPEELVREAEDCDIMVICYEEINDYVLDHLPNIKFIACSRGGVENVDKEAGKKASGVCNFFTGKKCQCRSGVNGWTYD